MRLCPLCQSDHSECVFTTPIGQTINCCSDCGFVFADNTPVVDYASKSVYACSEICTAKYNHYDRIVEKCLDHGITPDASVLDVGCALGNQMKKFLAAGFKTVHGLSISAEEVAQCVEQGLTAFNRNLDIMWPLAPYDLVIVSHVLEHVPEPIPFLRSLRRWVKPGGHVYIETPNALRYVDYLKTISQGFNGEHINHFSAWYLERALSMAGFLIEWTGEYLMKDAEGGAYPCARAIVVPTPPQAALRHFVEKYRDALIPQIESVREILRAELSGIERLSLWGLGQTYRILAPEIDHQGLLWATDSNPAHWGKVLPDTVVVKPEDFNPPPDVPILVCVQLGKQEIIEKIRSLGLTNKIITLEGKCKTQS